MKKLYMRLKIYHITLTVCAPYFVNLNNNTFQLKTLLLFVYLRSQQKRTESHLQLSNLQCCYFDIVILRVAIISNVQNVRLQCRHKPRDDASTRRCRGSQQTGPANYDTFITSLATLSLSNKSVNACPAVLYILSGYGSAKIIEIG